MNNVDFTTSLTRTKRKVPINTNLLIANSPTTQQQQLTATTTTKKQKTTKKGLERKKQILIASHYKAFVIYFARKCQQQFTYNAKTFTSKNNWKYITYFKWFSEKGANNVLEAAKIKYGPNSLEKEKDITGNLFEWVDSEGRFVNLCEIPQHIIDKYIFNADGPYIRFGGLTQPLDTFIEDDETPLDAEVFFNSVAQCSQGLEDDTPSLDVDANVPESSVFTLNNEEYRDALYMSDATVTSPAIACVQESQENNDITHSMDEVDVNPGDVARKEISIPAVQIDATAVHSEFLIFNFYKFI